MPSRLFRHFLLASLVLLAGCQCDEERPYTPFQVATNLPTEPSTAPEPAEERPNEDGFREIAALRAPKPSAHWEVFGRTLRAPAGTQLMSAVALGTADAESSGMVVGWALAKEPNGAEKQGIWAFDEQGRPSSRLAQLPEALPSGKDCEPRVDLTRTGPETVTAEIQMDCRERLLSGTPTRALLVLRPIVQDSVQLTLTLEEARPGERLLLDVESTDRDGDGSDDVAVYATLREPGGGAASASFRWLARPAGLSRDATAPGDAFARESQEILAAAGRASQREEALSRISALRRLTFALCAESKAAILSGPGGNGLRCGDLRPVHSRLTLAEILAHLGSDQPLRALGAFEHAEFYFGPPSKEVISSARKALLKKIGHAPATHEQLGPAPSSVAEPYPVGSPLRFDDEGRLWGLEASGRVVALQDPSEGSGGAPGDAPRPWARRPRGPGGQMLAAALPSCNRSEVQLSLVRPDGTLLPPVPVDVLAPRPAACRDLGAAPLSAVPVEWRRGQLLAIVAGQPVTTGGNVTPPSSAGVAWGTTLGLVVWHSGGLEIWTDTPRQLSHCAVRPDRKQVACIADGQVVLVTRP